MRLSWIWDSQLGFALFLLSTFIDCYNFSWLFSSRKRGSPDVLGRLLSEYFCGLILGKKESWNNLWRPPSLQNEVFAFVILVLTCWQWRSLIHDQLKMFMITSHIHPLIRLTHSLLKSFSNLQDTRHNTNQFNMAQHTLLFVPVMVLEGRRMSVIHQLWSTSLRTTVL